VEITGIGSEEKDNALVGVTTEVDWYKVPLNNGEHNMCVDPSDGVKVWEKGGGPDMCGYGDIPDLMKKMEEHDHSRHCVPGKKATALYTGLTGEELGTSRETEMELRAYRVQNGSKKGAPIIRIAS
jgi:hypothetical protein